MNLLSMRGPWIKQERLNSGEGSYETTSNSWVKAGVMIKQSTTAGSNYVDALVTPDVSSNTPNVNGTGCVFPANAPGAGCTSPLPPVTPTVESRILELRSEGYGILKIGRKLCIGTSVVQRVLK